MKGYDFTPEYLTKDGKPWFPVMGEIHYSRYPAEYWRESLCKMKAGGVDVVSAYVIWIHHEEIEGEYDFSGSRNLKDFVQAVKDCGLKMILRIGPWCHGEVRNGGFPDWLLHKDFESRTNDEAYFSCVEKWYSKIQEQVADFLCTEDDSSNAIIGVQIENEYGHCGGLWGEEGELHMRRLTEIARKCGFNVPLFTATGWGGAVTGGLLPVMGGYCDAPWDPRTVEIEPSGNYIFTHERNDHNIGSDHGFGAGITFDMSLFPYLTAELGGGLQMTEHRRTVASASDIGAMSLVKLGSGVNLLGYYMYHGGTNPEGKLTTLQESKATGSPNDLPEKSYDFRAPVREYGQVSDTLRELKLLTYFVHDYNDEICTSKAFIPEDNPLKPADLSGMRYSFRSNGKSGWLFVNNYVRRHSMAPHADVTVAVPENLCGGKITFEKLDIKDGDYFFLPFNMKCGADLIKTAKVSPFCRIADGAVFYARDGETDFSDLFDFADDAGKKEETGRNILVLSRKDALNAWKTAAGGLLITEGALIQDACGKDVLISRSDENSGFQVWPPLSEVPAGFVFKGIVSKNLYPQGRDFQFAVYEPEDSCTCQKECSVNVSELSEKNGCRMYRIDAESAMTLLKGKKSGSFLSDCFLCFFYEGNHARLYAAVDGKRRLIADNFFSGTEYPWEIGLKRFAGLDADFSALELEIDALSEKDRIYFEKTPPFVQGKCCRLKTADLEYEVMRILNP